MQDSIIKRWRNTKINNMSDSQEHVAEPGRIHCFVLSGIFPPFVPEIIEKAHSCSQHYKPADSTGSRNVT